MERIGGKIFSVRLDANDAVGGFVAEELSLLNEYDDVDHPKHYTQYPVEVIEITERLSFLMGNIVKYVLRADHKGEPIKDLKKAQWYLQREISRRERESSDTM